KETAVSSLDQLHRVALEHARAGATFQRYKGLGEMNAEELADTTMKADSRTLLKVTMEDAVGADQMFTVLMGDAVEPRREFIEKYALDVATLDIYPPPAAEPPAFASRSRAMPNERQVPVPIEEEMRKSYLDYAMSVIVGRALPDIRDGL